MNTDYEYFIYGSYRLVFLILEFGLLLPVLLVSFRVNSDTIVYFVLACAVPITLYVLLKTIKNICMMLDDYELSLQPVFITIDYFMHNLIHVTFIINTELYILHSGLYSYKYNWLPFLCAVFFAAFLASCTCFIDSIITNLFIVVFTCGTLSLLLIMRVFRTFRAWRTGKKYVPPPAADNVKFFVVFLIVPYFINFWHFLLSALSLVARYTADSDSDFSLADESIHAYSTYLIEFRPLSILFPVFTTVPAYRQYLNESLCTLSYADSKHFLKKLFIRKATLPKSILVSNRLRPISARTV